MNPLSDSVRNALRQARQLRRAIVLLTMSCGSGIGLVRLFAEPLGNASDPLIVILILLHLVLGGILLLASNEAPDVAADLLSEIDKNRDLKGRMKRLEKALTRASARHTYLQMLTQQEVNTAGVTRADINRKTELAISFLESLQSELFETTVREKWGYCLYEYDSSVDTLVCVAWKRAWKTPPGHVPRPWKPGEGHVGAAFLNKGELIFPDADKPEVKQLVDPGSKAGAYDDFYKSVASIPIFDGENGSGPILGVVVATSNRKGRFDPSQKAELEPLRDWARFHRKLLARESGK